MSSSRSKNLTSRRQYREALIELNRLAISSLEPESLFAAAESQIRRLLQVDVSFVAGSARGPEPVRELELPIGPPAQPYGWLCLHGPRQQQLDALEREFVEQICELAALSFERRQHEDLRAQRQFTQLASSLREAQLDRDAFLGVAVHELRGPITLLSGYLDLLSQQLRPDQPFEARHQRTLKIAAEQLQLLKRLLHDLFETAQLQTGEFEIERHRLDLRKLLHRLIEAARIVARGHRLILEAAEPAVILGDERRLEQVVHNLLGNAIKYSPLGSEIRIKLNRVDGMARIDVSDQGIGIPHEALGQIFRPFYRAPNASRIEGSGIGLYVVKAIITRHEGRIEVQSAPGRGSTFLVYLPLVQET